MRSAVLFFLFVVATVHAADDPGFVAHEWGTFTNFSGSDGVCLEFRPTIKNELPSFVYDRPRQAGIQLDLEGYYGKGGMRANVRMETPVLYFYTDRMRKVNVRVQFPSGLLTEFYPPVRWMLPVFERGKPEPLTGGSLDWGWVRIFPESMLSNIGPGDQGPQPGYKAELPKVEGDNPYQYARETDSAIVRVCGTTGVQGDEFEKFLFYRGVGNFSLPVSVRAAGGDRFLVANSGTDAIHSVFAVAVEGGKVRFAQCAAIPPGKEADLTLPAGLGVDALSEAMAKALVAEGLYEKEARAMVKTWRASWFGEEGTRVFYLVPPAVTERLLPLSIDPKPRELVRVLVGRVEALTPEREREIEATLSKLGAESPAEREAASKGLLAMGRFAEPALKRVHDTTTDAEVRARAQQLLEQITAPR